jgi:hypothetical protein
MLGTQKGSGLITDPLPASIGNEFIIWKMAKVLSDRLEFRIEIPTMLGLKRQYICHTGISDIFH